MARTLNSQAYAPAIQKAQEHFRNHKEIPSQTIPFLGTEYQITLPEGKVQGPDGPAPVMTQLIILHYIIRSDGTKPSGNMVTFREVPEGNFYFHSLHDRVLKPFLAAFGRDPNLLRERGEALCWEESEIGDVSLQTDALPLVPIRFVLWYGDEELEPEASVLFDSTIPSHLHTEDIALLAEAAVGVLS